MSSLTKLIQRISHISDRLDAEDQLEAAAILTAVVVLMLHGDRVKLIELVNMTEVLVDAAVADEFDPTWN